MNMREVITELISYAQGSERILEILHRIQFANDGLKNLIEVRPDLGPELEVASQALLEAAQATDRAYSVIKVKFDIVKEEFDG
jgi:hypothetical protein